MEFSNIQKAYKHKLEVTNLNLQDQELDAFPPKIKRFFALEVLDISKNPVSIIPAWMKRLEQLRVLDISHTAVKDIPKELIECQALEQIVSKRLSAKVKRQIKELLALLKDLRKINSPLAIRSSWYDLFYGLNITKIKEPVLLLATNSTVEKVRQHALKELSNRFEKRLKKRPVTENSQLCFAGILTNRSYFLDKLQQASISVVPFVNDQTTHVVIGDFIGIPDPTIYENNQLSLMTEQNLQQALDILETPYLQRDGFDDGIKNLQQMLEGDANQVELAFEIMSGGGVPESLVTDLFIIWKLHYNSYLQSRAKRLLARYANPVLAEWIKNDDHYLPGMTERQLTIYLKRCQKKAKLDAAKIVEELYRKHQKGKQFIEEKGLNELLE